MSGFRRLIIQLLLPLLIGSATVFGGDDRLPEIPPGERAPSDTLFDEPLSRGLRLVYQDRFAEGVAVFDSLQQAYPDHPGPYFYRAATYQTWMSSYRFNRFQTELERDVQLAIEKGELLLQDRPYDPWLNFYIGASLGYRAFFKMRSWNFIGAYRDGVRGIGNFEEALEKQKIVVTEQTLMAVRAAGATGQEISLLARLQGHTIRGKDLLFDTIKNLIGKDGRDKYAELVYQNADRETPIYDVFLGLGSYHYWRTARSKFIRVIAFWMADKRDFGLEQMAFSIRHGRYCPAEATLVLVTALIDYEKFDRALTVLDEFMQREKNRTMSALYLRGRIMIARENWGEVKAIYGELLSRLEAAPYPSIGYQVECKYWITAALAGMGDTAAARQLAAEALAQADQRDESRELEGQYDSFKDIRKNLEKLHQRLE